MYLAILVCHVLFCRCEMAAKDPCAAACSTLCKIKGIRDLYKCIEACLEMCHLQLNGTFCIIDY